VLGALTTLAGGLVTCVLLGAGSALLFGVLAVRYGDRFWYGLRPLRWFWPVTGFGSEIGAGPGQVGAPRAARHAWMLG
jgi:hypothetical protein